ncbi:MAG TPA: nucleotidyl transferase AbiEii/AbiGii toxin family protein [Stellaceae bacterium]|nr:nucleotidyl transferase AbiEii/AbiGii toxin family protein [Stellaceae bacterium]
MGGGWRNGSKSCAVPLSRFQSEVLRALAAQHGPDSYIAGGIAINRTGPRFSADIDIFHDSEDRLEAAAQADAAALTAAGYGVTWQRTRTGKREAIVERSGEAMQLEWVTDASFRFFPTQPDELFGYVPHPVDLAANKASAAADRRAPRDIVDLVTIHETILPLGAVICAAVGKFPGVTPEEMLAEVTRHSRFTAEEFEVLATERPVDVPGLHHRIRAMLEAADNFIARLPSDAVGVVFMEGDTAVEPDVTALDKYQRNPGAPGGFWPSSPEIGTAMLERYTEPPPERGRSR